MLLGKIRGRKNGRTIESLSGDKIVDAINTSIKDITGGVNYFEYDADKDFVYVSRQASNTQFIR